MANENEKIEVVQKYYFRKEGIIEKQGYDWIGEARLGFYPVLLDKKMGIADCNGKIVVPIVWESMELKKLNEDLIPVKKEKWGFANVKTGETQVEPIYDEVNFFKEGFAPVRVKDKWGIIDVNGNMIVEPKYLLDSHFVQDFAIMFEGGSWEYGNRGIRMISNANCKIINKKGYEIVSGYSWIERTGINTFTLTRQENNGQEIKTVKQFIIYQEYIFVIDDGEYEKGYITAEGQYSREWQAKANYYFHAKYTGGGNWSVMDHTGKTIEIPKEELQKKVKENLIMNS